MNIQNILFPSTHVCDEVSMYYNLSNNATLYMDNECCVLDKGEELQANTYFNSISIGKWKKYTILNNLSLSLYLKGTFLIYIHHAQRINDRIITKKVSERYAEFNTLETISISIDKLENIGAYYFSLRSLEDHSEFRGGFYETNINELNLPDIKIAVGICTYKREPFIAQNIKTFNDFLINNVDSPLYKHLEIFISDNGKTLSQDLSSEHIRIYSNKNLGGAGGFTRCMVEILNVKKKLKLSHILLMDDDIRIDPNSLVITYNLLRLLKGKYKHAFIGGHMLRLDMPHIQSEAADHWDIITHHPVKYNYNLKDINNVLKNEVEDSVNYLGWWYCCMPLDIINNTNLPLPLFIKRDDIEYGLRNGHDFINLNGICVWHEPFEYKNSSYLEYYYMRNMCIINSRHRLSFTKKRLIKELKKQVINALLIYRFKEAELSLIGVQDYLKGIDWFKTQDGEILNQAIMQLGYKKKPVGDFDFTFIHGQFEQHLKYPNERRIKRTLRRLSLNGWLLPANRNIIVPINKPAKGYFFRAAKVLNYEDATGMAFITNKSYINLFYIMRLFWKTKRLIIKKFDVVTTEYRNRYEELTNLEFWNEYLKRTGEPIEIKSGYTDQKVPKNTKYQIKELVKSYIFRFFQYILFFVPVKKNRVMFYAHDRKGFACNPKYIVQNIYQQYGNQLEIIWVTMYPESCKQVQNLGIKVIEANSKEHIFYYMRTKIYITNDCFPSWAAHKWNQKWINTWHAGMNYKHIGYNYLAPMSKCNTKLFRIKNRRPDYFLSGSAFFTENTSESFDLDRNVFIPTGLPRNDVFFNNRPDIESNVRKRYHIDTNSKIALFAPTFRRGMKSQSFGLDFLKLSNALTKRFGGNWVILFRNHNFVKGKQCFPNTIDVSMYDDMQELLYVSDVLVTDFSSCMWDFSLTKKPCFIYATDIYQYANEDRSFAYPIENWPFSIAINNDELIKNIDSFNEENYKNAVTKHLDELGSYDRGNASQQVSDIIAKYCL